MTTDNICNYCGGVEDECFCCECRGCGEHYDNCRCAELELEAELQAERENQKYFCFCGASKNITAPCCDRCSFGDDGVEEAEERKRDRILAEMENDAYWEQARIMN